jgi:protein-S-isoprenylcysteine O-methyltransferase Ste14
MRRLLLPLVLVVVQRGVVRREERYLEAKFGQEYRDYTARVSRWLRWPKRAGRRGIDVRRSHA